MCNIFKMLFNKKKVKNWTFNSNPVVNWLAKNKVKYDMVTICKLILTQILNIDDVELNIVNNDSQIKIFDTPDFKLEAMLIGYPNSKQYTLFLRSDILSSNVLSIVCHEMWHLEQMYKGQLQIIKPNFKWKGKIYEGSTPYFERPWEKEAIKEQVEIERKVKKLYYE